MDTAEVHVEIFRASLSASKRRSAEARAKRDELRSAFEAQRLTCAPAATLPNTGNRVLPLACKITEKAIPQQVQDPPFNFHVITPVRFQKWADGSEIILKGRNLDGWHVPPFRWSVKDGDIEGSLPSDLLGARGMRWLDSRGVGRDREECSRYGGLVRKLPF